MTRHANSADLIDFEAFRERVMWNWPNTRTLAPVGSGGEFSASLGRMVAGAALILDIKTSGYAASFGESRLMGIVLPRAAPYRAGMDGRGVAIAPGNAFFCPRSLDAYALGGDDGHYDGRHLFFDREALRRYAEAYEGCRLEFEPGAEDVVPVAQLGGLLNEIDRVMDCAAGQGYPDFAPDTAAVVEDRLMRAFLESPLGWRLISARRPRGAAAGRKAVARAIDFIEANHGQPLRLDEISATAGVSTRCLQIAFQRALGMTPWQYLTRVRLEAARRCLSVGRDDASVTAIALNAGFSHLGEFARQYRQRYGERPSDTHRRARGR
ncbi:MAG: AraC family transcriptional regulator [Rhodoblastus sp.]